MDRVRPPSIEYAVLLSCIGCTATVPLGDLQADATATVGSAGGGTGASVSSAPASSTSAGGCSGGSYADMVLADGAVGYWRFNEANTPAALDATSNHYDGVYQGGVELGVAGAIYCDADPAVRLNGNASIDMGQRFAFTGGPPFPMFSVEAWVKPEATKPQSFFGAAYYDTEGYHGYFVAESNDNFRFQREAKAAVSVPLVRNLYSHIAATFDGVTMRLYVNGTRVEERTVNTAIATHDTPFVVGDTAGDWGTFEGSIDELAIYDVNLSDAQIDAHHRTGIGAP